MMGGRSLKAGRLDEAEERLAKAIAVDPAYPLARYLLGRVHLAQGRFDEAEVQLGAARAFSSSTSFPDVLDLLKEIEAARKTPDG